MINLSRLLTFMLFILSIHSGYTQEPGDQMFDNSYLHEVRFDFDQADYWETMVNNFETAPEGGPFPYLMGTVSIDGELIDSVGIRFKGFTSYTYEESKKPIKIDFNEYVKGKKYDGLKKLNLNNSTGDPSMQRDVVCYDLLRNLGVKAPRASYSKVYFNDQYWGVYQNIEQVDKAFLKRNFSNGKGNLFKNKGWSHFEWEGSDPDSYHPPFELKTNEEGDDWSGFVNLMDVLNNSSDTAFPSAIEEIFNVNLFLKTLAIDVATNNWDSYLEHGRNWYIYEDTATHVFNWIPWDYNFALGGGAIGTNYGNDCFINPQMFITTDGSTTVDFVNLSFYFNSATFLWEFGDGTTSTQKNSVHTYTSAGNYNVCLTITSGPNCEEKICETINTNTVSPVCPVISNGTCPHPANAIFNQVVDWVPACCDEWGEVCENIYNYISSSVENFGAGDFTINQQENTGVLIKRLLSVPEFNNRYYGYFCDLLNQHMTTTNLFELIDHNHNLISHAVELEPYSLFTFEAFETDISTHSDTVGIKAILSARIDSLQVELAADYTCSTVLSDISWHDIVINEFMAATDSTGTILDPAGEVEDWIELFNNSSGSVNLSGVYLSDNIDNPQKWQFPSETHIPAGEYLIVWADKAEEQVGLHSDFKLKKSGEQIILSNTGGTVIDSLSFGLQPVNIASARIPNGTGDFVFQTATLASNNETVGTLDLDRSLAVNIYPIPANNQLTVNIKSRGSSDYSIRIFTATGQLMLQQKQSQSTFNLNLENWNEGFYFLQITDDTGKVSGQKFIISR